MPLSSSIQFYVDQEFISIERALNLSAEQIQVLEKQFVKRIISSHTIGIEYFLIDMDPEGKKQINLVAACLEDYINNGLLSQNEFDNLDLGQCSKLGQQFIRDLLLSRRITINQALELDTTYLMSLDGLNGLINAGKLTQEQILTFTNQQVINLKQICDLILHDVVSIDEALGFTEEQANRFRFIHYLAQLASYPGKIGTNVLETALGPWYDYFDGVDPAISIAKVRTLMANHEQNEIFTAPLNTLNFPSPNGRSCNLFFNNILTLQVLAQLTPEQERKLNCDGIYNLLLNNHLTTEQVFALTQGQCYQLDDPAIRAQIIAGELALTDIPEPAVVVMPPAANNAPLNINHNQSTHTASVHQTVSESATRLMNRYGTQLDPENLEILIDHIKNWICELHTDNLINDTAKRCISRIGFKNYIHTDPVSGVTTRQLLALSWLAIHDENLRQCELADAKNQFLQGLYEIQREYNLDEIGNDLGGHDLSACPAGTFNKLMEKLANIHPDARIEFITGETAALKLKVIVMEEIQSYLTEKANPLTSNDFLNFTNLLKQLEQDGVEIIWDDIKEKITARMHEEFHSLFASKDDPKFTAFIDAGQYFELNNLSSFQKNLLESKGYQQYCSSILRASGIFSGLVRQNSIPAVNQQNVDHECEEIDGMIITKL